MDAGHLEGVFTLSFPFFLFKQLAFYTCVTCIYAKIPPLRWFYVHGISELDTVFKPSCWQGRMHPAD